LCIDLHEIVFLPKVFYQVYFTLEVIRNDLHCNSEVTVDHQGHFGIKLTVGLAQKR